jgi:DNA gyrase/topoisomerase IV subunit B
MHGMMRREIKPTKEWAEASIQRYKGLGEMNANNYGKPQWILASEHCAR